MKIKVKKLGGNSGNKVLKMIKKTINITEYDSIDKQGKLFFFSLIGCGSCNMFESKTNDVNHPFYKVLTDNEEDYLTRDIGFVPYTILFDKKGEIVYRKSGVLFDKQVNELNEIIRKEFL